MAKYMTQQMRFGTKTPVTYYRKQSAHPSHTESGGFTADAKNDYATTNGIPTTSVEVGSYKSSQGIPTGGTTKEI